MQITITAKKGGKKNTDADSKSYVIADCRSVEQVDEILKKEFKDYFTNNSTLTAEPIKTKKPSK